MYLKKNDLFLITQITVDVVYLNESPCACAGGFKRVLDVLALCVSTKLGLSVQQLSTHSPSCLSSQTFRLRAALTLPSILLSLRRTAFAFGLV